MVLLCKQKALYVKCCIIANGVTDSQGDTLYREDIKKIFTSFNNQDNFEVYHNDIPIQEVSLLENYISVTDETIGTAVVPSGSWNAVIRVDNPEIQSALLTGEFGGVSLNNRIAEKCKGNLTGQVRYQDIADAECIIPLLISFVESGANGYGLHVMDYDAYIQKSKTVKNNGARRMDFNEFLDGVKALIKKAEDTSEDEPVIIKEDDTPVEEETIEEEPVVKKEDSTEEDAEDETTEEEPTVEKEDTTVEEEEEAEAEIDKADDLEERIAKLEELIQQLLPQEEVVEETEEEVVDEDTPKITKSEKVIVENKTQNNVNYYEMTNRDPLTGMKIRKESKIL